MEKEKDASVAITTEILPKNTLGEEVALKPNRLLAQAIWTIVCGVALPCIPIIIIISVLLFFIFHHRIHLNPGFPSLEAPKAELHNTSALDCLTLYRKQGGQEAYYVQFNTSTITTIAAWTGRIIPYLTSSIMALVAFFAARRIVITSKRGDASDLPNPEQLTMLINLLGGKGFNPLKDVLQYRYSKKEKLVAPLPAAAFVLLTITLLGLVIPVIDSWFGVATTTTSVTQLYPRSAKFTFGRGLSSQNCPTGPQGNTSSYCLSPANADAFWPCNVYNYGCQATVSLLGLNGASKTIQGVSTQNKVYNYTDRLGMTYTYLGDPAQSSLVDYQANTVATSSQCAPMTQKCYHYNESAYDTDPANPALQNIFNCTPAFTGSIFDNFLNSSVSPYDLGEVTWPATYPNIGLAFAKDAELTIAGNQISSNQTLNDGEVWYVNALYTTNPLNYGVFAVGFPQFDVATAGADPFDGDPGVAWNPTLNAGSGGIWQLNCSTTVYDVSYSWVNGAVNTFNATPSSSDMAALLSAPWAWGTNMSWMPSARASIAQAAAASDTSHDLAETFARVFARYIMAYSVGAFQPIPNVVEQARNSTIQVALVPLIPLYLLLGTKALYVLAVILLAISAYCFTHPAETEVVKAQLSVKGLAAAHFDSPGLLQANVVKQVQSRLSSLPSRSGTAGSDASKTPLTDVREISPAPVNTLGDTTAISPSQYPEALPLAPKIGLMPGLDGVWRFAVVADGVWNFIKPIVDNTAVTDAKAGDLGGIGDVINAWE